MPLQHSFLFLCKCFSVLECTENVSQSFGKLDIKYMSKFDPDCTFFLGKTEIGPKRWVVVSIQRMSFRYCRYVPLLSLSLAVFSWN